MKEGRWAYYFLGCIAVVGLLADVLANDRPIVASFGGELRFPAVTDSGPLPYRPPSEADWSIWPPVPWRASITDLAQANFQPPLAAAPPDEPRHLLGTDRYGRDTLAGLINGTRVALVVGAGSLLISLLIGVPLGAAAGFFGNGGLRISRGSLLALVAGTVIGCLYASGSLLPLAGLSGLFFLMLLLCVVVCCGIAWAVMRGLARVFTSLQRPVGVPIDWAALLVLELAISIPGLVLLIAILSFVDRPPLWLLVAIIGLLGWTPIARFLRAELMRIRELPYIAAARMGGVGELRLLLRHALPNAIGPVAVVAAFGVGTSILAEAMLSFLGIGVPADQVTWGSLLSQARARPEAWWLAAFPGLLLTLTVLACNSLRRPRG